MKLFNISPRFEEVTIEDFDDYFGHRKPFIIDGVGYYLKEPAFEAFQNVFKKLIVDFEWVE